MKEIITKGTRKTAKCKYCGCLFAYEHEDIEVKDSTIHRGEHIKYVSCPQCNEHYILEQPR